MSALGDLSSSGYGYLPGWLTMFPIKKKTFKKNIYIPIRKIKYGSKGSISNVDLGLF